MDCLIELTVNAGLRIVHTVQYFSRVMLGGEGERSRGKPGKKGKKKKDDDAVDSPRPLGMPPSYPISDVSLALFSHKETRSW